MKYKAGQKVRVREDLKSRTYTSESSVIKANVNLSMLKLSGKTVVIKEVNPFGIYHIENLPDCGWVAEMFEPIHNEKIVITTDGVTTTAKKYDGKKIIKEAKAICSKDDVFNFEVGAKLAMERLLGGGIPEKSLYNGRVICTNNNGSPLYVTGKIYEFVNGELTENGAPLCCAPKDVIIRSLRDWQRHSIAEWLEVVE